MNQLTLERERQVRLEERKRCQKIVRRLHDLYGSRKASSFVTSALREAEELMESECSSTNVVPEVEASCSTGYGGSDPDNYCGGY